MQIPKNILKELKSLIKEDGIVKTSDGSEINYRTLKRISKTGSCKEEFFLKIKSYLEKRDQEVKQLIGQEDQD